MAGWLWTTAAGTRFRTDGDGRGLWVWSADRGDWMLRHAVETFALPADPGEVLGILRTKGLTPRTRDQGE